MGYVRVILSSAYILKSYGGERKCCCTTRHEVACVHSFWGVFIDFLKKAAGEVAGCWAGCPDGKTINIKPSAYTRCIFVVTTT